MNITETVEFMRLFERMRPDFVGWRSEHARRLAAEYGTSDAAENRGIIESIAKSFAEITTDEAAEVLDAMERGSIACPMFGVLGGFIRSQVLVNREGRAQATKYDREGEQRFDCLDCRDTGMVEVFNPQFVHDYRAQFLEFGGKLPRDWFSLAYRWWLGLHRGPMLHVALCACACDERRRLMGELEQARTGRRRGAGNKPLGFPACGNYVWRPEETPRVDSRLNAGASLTRFYRSAG